MARLADEQAALQARGDAGRARGSSKRGSLRRRGQGEVALEVLDASTGIAGAVRRRCAHGGRPVSGAPTCGSASASPARRHERDDDRAAHGNDRALFPDDATSRDRPDRRCRAPSRLSGRGRSAPSITVDGRTGRAWRRCGRDQASRSNT